MHLNSGYREDVLIRLRRDRETIPVTCRSVTKHFTKDELQWIWAFWTTVKMRSINPEEISMPPIVPVQEWELDEVTITGVCNQWQAVLDYVRSDEAYYPNYDLRQGLRDEMRSDLMNPRRIGDIVHWILYHEAGHVPAEHFLNADFLCDNHLAPPPQCLLFEPFMEWANDVMVEYARWWDDGGRLPLGTLYPRMIRDRGEPVSP